MTVNPLFDIIMNEQDIEMFMKAFDDFMQQSETAIEEQKHREEARLFCLLYTSPSPRDS